MTDTITILPADDASQLEFCERRIAAGLESFRDVGLALKHIRDNRLYRATHATFQDYCAERWNFSKSHGNNMILAAITIELLPDDLATVVAKSQDAARELAKVELEKREEVVKKASESGKVTAKAIKDAAAGIQGEPKPANTMRAPDDEDTRELKVTRKVSACVDEVFDFLTGLNPTRRDLLQAATILHNRARRLEHAASQLPEESE